MMNFILNRADNSKKLMEIREMKLMPSDGCQAIQE